MIEIHLSKESLVVLFFAVDVDGIEAVLDGFDELGEVHDPFASLLVHFLSVESLDGHLSKVLLYTEVDLGIGRESTNYW